MSHPSARPDPRLADETAAEWLLRRDAGLDVEQDPAFVAWRDADAANADAWTHAIAIWAASDRPASDDPLIAALRRDALQARPQRLPALAALAASLVLIVGAALFAWPQLAPRPAGPGGLSAPPADAPATFANGGGAPNSYALADGSRVTLNANSAIAVAFDDRRRAVRLLRGQAFFSVARDAAARPFSVAAGTRTITDIGTEFDVRLGGPSITVTLVKGAVAVSGAQHGRSTTLDSPGAQLAAAPGKPDAVATVDLAQALSWRTPMLAFSDRPLADALDEVNRYGGPPARVVDASVAALPVSGQFRAGDPSRFANALTAAYPLSVRARPDGGSDLARRDGR